METAAAWALFCGQKPLTGTAPLEVRQPNVARDDVPVPGALYISTRTKIAFLTSPVALEDTFWAIPITPHSVPVAGVIKKQMKFNCASAEELGRLRSNIPTDTYVVEHVIKHIEPVQGRIGYCDVRKIGIGVCNKDVTSYRCKKKGAFYNCFSVILRVEFEGSLKEMHIKVFNTGKLEVPGVQNVDVFNRTLDMLCAIISKARPNDAVGWLPEKTQTVLINSNFTVGFLIDRERLHERLRVRYKINSNYDPCSYPGIQCKYYHRAGKTTQTGQQPSADEPGTVKMSFMIFRTGSVLIVGRCTEDILYSIYSFICSMMRDEFNYISKGLIANTKPIKPKTKQRRFKTVMVPTR